MLMAFTYPSNSSSYGSRSSRFQYLLTFVLDLKMCFFILSKYPHWKFSQKT